MFGDGSQIRDFVYVDDAVNAFLAAGDATPATARRSTSAATSTSRIATSCSCWSSSLAAGAIASSSGRPRRRRSTSAASTPTRRASRKRRGWPPPCPLREGLARTLAFYREHIAALPRRRGGAATAHERPLQRAHAGRRRGGGRGGDRPRRSTAAGSSSGPRSKPSKREFAAACGARHSVGVGTGTDAITLIAARARHRPRRRGDHVAAVGRLLGACHHDGRRTAGVRRHRSRSPDARPGGGGGGGHAADPRHPAGASLRSAGRHGRPRASRRAPSPGDRRRRVSGASGDGGRPPGRNDWHRRARSASIRRRTSARWATAARSRPATRGWPSASSGCATAGRPRATTTRSRREQPARRNAGGDSARAPAVPPGWTERRARIAGSYRSAIRGSAGRRAARTRRRARLSPVSGARAAAPDFAGAPGRSRHRDADSLPGANPAAACAMAVTRPAECPIADRVCHRGRCHCRCILR